MVHDPESALALLRELGAPLHLVRHHELVVEAARELVDGLRRFADLFDTNVVLLGAALHDVGKIVHPNEMTGPGSQHELDGERLLREHGAGEFARFSTTHAQWRDNVALEDLLVALADTLWKGRRNTTLEKLIVERLARSSGLDFWSAFIIADDAYERVAAGADDRLERSRLV